MRRLTIFALALLLALSCAGCAPSEAEATFLCMDTVVTMRVLAKNPQPVLDGLRNLFEGIEGRLSAYDVNSDVGRVNLASGNPVVVDAETLDLFVIARAVWEATNGAFNPCMLPAMRAWGFSSVVTPREPDEPERAALREVCDPLLVVTDEAEGLMSASRGTMLDLGGIAKGYAGDMAVEWLSENSAKYGISSAILSLGGNVVCYGARPGGSPWQVGVRDPRDAEKLIARAAVTDAHVITSSGAERFYITGDGRRIHHIIDPQTMAPADAGLLSVTIVSREGALADALSTAVFVLGEDAGVAVLTEAYPQVGYLLMRSDGTLAWGGPPELSAFAPENGL